MSIDPGIHRILVSLDLHSGSDQVFAHALKLALCTGATLSAVHVRTDPDAVADWTRAPSALQLLVAWGVLPPTATEADVAALELHVERDDRVSHNAELGLISAVIERLPNIIVLGTEARTGWQRLRDGSVAEAVARRSGAVTLFLPRDASGFVDPTTGAANIRRVLLPLGGKVTDMQHAVAVLEAMLDVLRVTTCTITRLHVGPGAMPALSLPERPGWTWETDMRNGDVVDGIVDAMTGGPADLVVMGTRGHDSLADAIRGSKTEQVLRRATCPVLAVPLG